VRKANGRVVGVHVKEGPWRRVEIGRCQGPYLCSMCVRGTDLPNYALKKLAAG
jgi:hypothetical protein